MEGLNLIDEIPYGESAETMALYTSDLDDMSADECIQKIGNWEKYREFWIDFYKAKIEEVKQKCDNNIELQKRLLREYFKVVPHRSTKTMEAYDLPSGKISMAFGKQTMVPNKEAILNRFIKQGDDEFIKVKRELNWDGYKARLFIASSGEVLDKETGEVVSDVDVEMSEPKFSVTINKKGGKKDGDENPDA